MVGNRGRVCEAELMGSVGGGGCRVGLFLGGY
jgi:hypothetical protein